MMYTKEFLLDEINSIREEIGHDKVNIFIEDIHLKNDELWIITEDRPDKSAIIGKGGWVVGKLREKLGLESIHVESYGDFLNKKYKLELSSKTIKNLDLDLVGLKNLERTIESKLDDIYSFSFETYFDNLEFEESENTEAVVALSGGVDSSFSLILAKKLGFNPKAIEDRKTLNASLFGIEKKPLPYLLGITNLLLHDIDNPMLLHGNSLEQDVHSYTEKDRFHIILMNPPYGGGEQDGVKMNFPSDLRSSETADLFMSVILYRLKKDGRAAVILPDGFLFGTDGAKRAIKEKLMKECNLHTIVRMPSSVFAPYTSICTNILFFDKTGPTKETWIYRLDMPDGIKHFSKTKPMQLKHFDPVVEWWDKREPIQIDGADKARKFTIDEIKAGNYNLDLCGYPHEDEEILPPDELIAKYRKERKAMDERVDAAIAEIEKLLKGE